MAPWTTRAITSERWPKHERDRMCSMTPPSTAQTRELDRMEEQNRQLRAVIEDVLALAFVLRKGTINRIMAMSDVEIGLQALLGSRPASRR